MNLEPLDNVTPVILTYNEEPNIGRTLESVRWAKEVIVVDSGSDDQTERISRRFPNVSWHVRPFDSFKCQWEHAIHRVGVSTKYILGLDADMEVPSDFVTEIAEEFLPRSCAGGIVPFRYCYNGHALRSSLCLPQLRIFDRGKVTVAQPAHGHRFEVAGATYRFRTALFHDDRKPLERWVEAQIAYAQQNAEALQQGGPRPLRDHLRRMGVMPPIMAILAYLRAGGPLKGAAAARYAYERGVAEGLLAIRLMDSRMANDAKPK